MDDEASEVTLLVSTILEDLGIPYVIGGSVASSYHGLARTTLDCDLVADLSVEHIGPFCNRLKGEFYVSEEAIAEAIVYRSSFNIVHLSTMFKVDIFIPKARRFDQLQIANAQRRPLAEGRDEMVQISTPEDSILAKLEWYRMGGEVSERQWRDVLEVMTLQWERLDWNYLAEMAAELGVGDLLARARATCEV